MGASKKALLVFGLLAVCAATGIVVALRPFEVVQIGYNIVPPAQASAEVESSRVYVLTDRSYYYSVINDLRRANSSIYVVMYSMIYDPEDPFDWANDLIRGLVNAKKRGVDVKVVIEYRTYYGYMSDNLKAHEYLSSNGVSVKLDQENDTDHLKLVVVDGKIVYVGSHNWSEAALYYNREASIKVVSEEVARQFLEYLKSNYGF